jgi:hypothetical protein
MEERMERCEDCPSKSEFKGTAAEYRALAKAKFQDEGSIEIDDNARIAQGAACGAYVEAWVWVDNPNWDWDNSVDEGSLPRPKKER